MTSGRDGIEVMFFHLIRGIVVISIGMTIFSYVILYGYGKNTSGFLKKHSSIISLFFVISGILQCFQIFELAG